MESMLFSKVYGHIIGAAVGDAMGAPVENMHFTDIKEQFGVVDSIKEYYPRYMGGKNPYETYSFHWFERKKIRREELKHPYGAWIQSPGVYTDDMRFRLLILKSYLKKGGRVTGWEAAKDLLEYRIENSKYSHEDPRYKWSKSMFNLEELFHMCFKTPFGSSPLVGGAWGAPAGLINACDPKSAAEDGGIIAAIVAEAMRKNATVDRLLNTAFGFSTSLPDADYDILPSWSDAFKIRLEKALSDADKSKDVLELISRLYKWICATCPPWSTQIVFESVPVALAMIYKSKGDFKETMIGTVNFGRDCDTIACIAGEILGTLIGVQRIPEEWVSLISEKNPEPNLKQIAEKMSDIIEKEAKRKADIAEEISNIIN